MNELIEVDGLSADLEVVEDIVEVIELAEQGPPGPPGEAGPEGVIDLTSMASLINTSGAITTPADADKFGFRDSVSGLFAHVTWANILVKVTAVITDWGASAASIFKGRLLDHHGVAVAIGNIGAAYTLDLTNGSRFEGTLTSNATFTMPAAPTAGQSRTMTIIAKQAAAGGPHSVTFSGGGGAVFLSTTTGMATGAGKITVWVFTYVAVRSAWVCPGAIQEA